MKKNALSVAVAASVAAAAAYADTDSMFLSGENTGQVILFPYYNAENGNNSAFHVVNTTAETKAVKIRIMEYVNSDEVLDFNLYLSPYDHFSWVMVKDKNGDGAAIKTFDNSCTVPALGSPNPPFNGYTDDDGGKVQPMVNFAYAADDNDSITRSLAGHIEVIEMGDLDNSTFEAAVKHGATGTPAKCATVQDAWLKSPVAWTTTDVTAPTGGLYGLSYALDVNDAAAFGIDPTTIDDFSSASLHNAPGDELPSLNDADANKNAWVQTVGGAYADQAYGTRTVDAVSAMMMTTSIQNDVMTNAAVGGQSDWVITFPTKRFYVDPDEAGTAAPIAPFAEEYLGVSTSTVPASLACEDVSITMFDREEQTVTIDRPGFSPQPPEAKAAEICLEMNVIQMGLESSLNAELPVSAFAFAFDDGWAKLNFLGIKSGSSYTRGIIDPSSGENHAGLPTIGFLATKYENNSIADGAFNYGHVAVHKYERAVS
jgi:hypothetical protein